MNWREKALKYEFKLGVSTIQLYFCIILQGIMKNRDIWGICSEEEEKVQKLSVNCHV